MSEVKKPREFWIDPEPDGDDGSVQVYQALSKHPRQGPLQWQASLIHVIEKSAYDKAVEELKFVIKFCEKEGIYLTRSVDVLKELGVIE